MQLLGRFNWWAPRPLRALVGRGQPAARPAPQRPGPGLEHLEVTRYCDWRHSAVLAALVGVLDGDEPDRGTAIKLFRFVRDEILYEFGPWGVTASETLERRGGTCTNKANARVALLRAAGIPAA
jgi:transglutaminase-like putative cysteine protease